MMSIAWASREGQRAGQCEVCTGHQVPDECSKEHKLFKEKKIKSDSVIPTLEIKSKIRSLL